MRVEWSSRVVIGILFVGLPCCVMGAEPDSSRQSHIEFLPLLSYDSDAGVGYGLKSFFLNTIHSEESFDLTLFNSSGGERWYKFVFSLPDFEKRQGHRYALAVDLSVDYDKWISYAYFGTGNEAAYSDRLTYTREPLDISCLLSKGITEEFVAQVGVKWSIVRNYDFDSHNTLAGTLHGLSIGQASSGSLLLSGRYDTRNSFINATSGFVAEEDIEWAPSADVGNMKFFRSSTWLQSYNPLPFWKTTLALRGGMQLLSADDPPIQILVPVGGGSSIRGYPQDRYLDRVAVIFNAEVRFPLFFRFGGIVGYDVGKVWRNLNEVDIPRWISSPVAGLRYYFDTFVVRFDVGFGKETTAFYINFGQLF